MVFFVGAFEMWMGVSAKYTVSMFICLFIVVFFGSD